MKLLTFLNSKAVDTSPDLDDSYLVEINALTGDIGRLALQTLLNNAAGRPNVKYSADYANVTAAKAAIGSTPTRFIINSNLTVTGSDDVPLTMLVEFEGEGKITTTNATDIFVIRKIGRTDNKQRFFGPGEVRLGINATDGPIPGALWIPAPTTGTPEPEITQKMWTAMEFSLYVNTGGSLHLPQGDYFTSVEHLAVSGERLIGYASASDLAGCTRIRQATSGMGVVKIRGSVQSVSIEYMTAVLTGGTEKYGVRFSGTVADGEVNGIYISNFSAIGGYRGVGIVDTAPGSGWGVLNVIIEKSKFIGQADSNIFCNTVNSGITVINGNQLTPTGNGTSHAIKCETVGNLVVIGNNFAAPLPQRAQPYVKNAAFTNSAVNAGADTIGVTAHGFIDADRVFPEASGAFNAGLTLSPQKPIFVHKVDANNFSLHNTGSDSISGANKIDLNATGSGTLTLHGSRIISTDCPDACIYLGGRTANVYIGSNQAEGFNWLLKFKGNDDYSNPIVIDGMKGQAGIYCGSDMEVQMYGGTMLTRGIVDAPGVSARIVNYNCKAYVDPGTLYYTDLGAFQQIEPILDNFVGQNGTGVSSTFVSGNVNTGTDIINKTAHGHTSYDRVLMSTSGSFTGGLSIGGKYYVRKIDNDNYTLHTDPMDVDAGTNLVQLATTGSGTVTLTGVVSSSYMETEFKGGQFTHKGFSTFDLNQVSDSSFPDLAVINVDRRSNDAPYLKFRVKNTADTVIAEWWFERAGSGARAGWTVLANGFFTGRGWAGGPFLSQCGLEIEGGLYASEEVTSVKHLTIGAAALIKNLHNNGTIGFYQDGSQKAIRFTPDSPASLGGYFKVFNNTNGANEDLYFQFVPDAGGKTILDSYQANLVLATTGSTGIEIDQSQNSAFSGNLTIGDTKNVIVGTTTGCKFGTATSQKIGFWNAAPIVQPTTGVTAASFTANAGTAVNDASTFDGYTVGKVVAALRNVGLLA